MSMRCLHVFICTMYVAGQEKVLGPLRLELQTVVSNHVVLGMESTLSVRAVGCPTTESSLQILKYLYYFCLYS